MPPTLEAPTAAATASLAGKYLTFCLGAESYAVHVLRVREIIRNATITPVPEMPPYIRGVLNLRGKIIPVMDLRLRFGLAVPDLTERTCMVVASVELPSGALTQMGFVVDGVEEVVQIGPDDLEARPEFGVGQTAEYLLAMAKLKGVTKCLLDLDRVVSA